VICGNWQPQCAEKRNHSNRTTCRATGVAVTRSNQQWKLTNTYFLVAKLVARKAKYHQPSMSVSLVQLL
jgi:hypothetical protein